MGSRDGQTGARPTGETDSSSGANQGETVLMKDERQSIDRQELVRLALLVRNYLKSYLYNRCPSLRQSGYGEPADKRKLAMD